ncbi:MAG: sensor histidine kinase [Solirubrobacteraceae bacterium]
MRSPRAAGSGLDARVTIRIADRGPGISPPDQVRIFEPFYPAGGGTGGDDHGGHEGPDHGGSGLGLAIARGFVDTYGGRIRVESTPGRGSVFVIELPAAVSEAAR